MGKNLLLVGSTHRMYRGLGAGQGSEGHSVLMSHKQGSQPL